MLMGFIALATTGYLINDFSDLESDIVAGKSNFFISTGKRGLPIVLFSTIGTLIFWYLVGANSVVLFLCVVQIAFYFLYSVPPLRLKTGLFGVFLDASYSRVIPSLMSLVYFSDGIAQVPNIVLTAAWMLFVGIRNMLMHQLDDLVNDALANQRTFMGRFNEPGRLIKLFWLSLPFELAFMGLSARFSLPFGNVIMGSFLFHVLYLAVRYRVWNQQNRHEILRGERGKHLLNDLYAYVLPLGLLVHLTTKDHVWFWLLILHIAAFPALRHRFLSDLSAMAGTLKSFIEHQWIEFKLFMKYWVNQIIIDLFRVFGVDLVKRQSSALGYLRGWFRKKLRCAE